MEKKKLKITAVMSVPRLCFTDNMFCATSIFPSLGINIYRHSGAFWEQSLSNLLLRCVDEGSDYIITLDYDSIYSRDQVLELIRLMEESGADAIFAMQIKRDSQKLLLALHPDELADGHADLGKDLTRARTGHFGLTIIRCSSLAKLPHPWFCGRPGNESCKWDDTKIDPDIAFWIFAEHEGWKVYQANNVPIGHIQRVVTWPTRDLQVAHQYLDEWERDGMPELVKRLPARNPLERGDGLPSSPAVPIAQGVGV